MARRYIFQPFVLVRLEPEGSECPKGRSGHRIVCNEKYLYSYGGFNPSTDIDLEMSDDEAWSISKPLFKEIWKLNLATLQWRRFFDQEHMPNELASNALVLQGENLIVFGGTGVPFGDSCSNQLYTCDIDLGRMELVPATGVKPDPQYGQAVICHESHLYTVGGTTGHAYTCDIHKFNLKTRVWEPVYICSGLCQSEPKGRYRHELAFDGKLIYVLGGGTSSQAFGFAEISAFDLELNKWQTLKTHGDNTDLRVPECRRCHGCVQYTEETTGDISVIISGGYNEERDFDDVWRLNLKQLQWTRLRKCILPRPLYFHSAALTPNGQMYIFGGIVQIHNKTIRTDEVFSCWLTIPKLSEICWQALIYYDPCLKYKSRDDLLSMGIPRKFVERLDVDIE